LEYELCLDGEPEIDKQTHSEEYAALFGNN